MKRIFIIVLCIIFALSLVTVASAQNQTEDEGENSEEVIVKNEEAMEGGKKGDELRTYIGERLLPVLMGVFTSVIALLGTLKGVFSALKGLKESKAVFDKEQALIRENSRRELEAIGQKYEDLKATLNGVPELNEKVSAAEEQVKALKNDIANLSKIAYFAVADKKEYVMDGRMREIIRILGKNEETSKNETV